MQPDTLHIRKEHQGGILGYTWPHAGAVVEVPHAIGLKLLIEGYGFSEVTPSEASQTAEQIREEAEAEAEAIAARATAPLLDEADAPSGSTDNLNQAVKLATTRKPRSRKE